MVAAQKEPLIAIVGETASGKSMLALNLAKTFNGEIINADSWAVYKGFNIGTAKPSYADQQQIKHHMLDIAEPKDGFSAAIYRRLAMAAIENVWSRGKIPILVGGSGLYIDSILYSYSFLPPSSKKLRQKYNAMSLVKITELVKNSGYDTSGIDLGNKRRLIRLLENEGVRPQSLPLRPNTLILGIGMKSQPEKLLSNIEKRVEAMFNAGLEEEVRKLSALYGWDIEPMKGIGYREFKDYINGSQTLADVKRMIIKDSLKLAKKQRTWFKRNNSIHWVNNKSKIVELVTTYLNKFND
jgi:tRNA dimethylallyltransferase